MKLQLAVPDFGQDAGWRVDKHPRLCADLTGDGTADIVGFGDAGVRVALNNGDGTFGSPRLAVPDFGHDQGWRVDKHPRLCADLTGDGTADIVGFGDAGVRVALNNGDGTFGSPRLAVPDFGHDQGWRVDKHPRLCADLTGDGTADIVGFGDAGVRVALNNGDGTFGSPRLVLPDFGHDRGWRVDKHPRQLADLTADGTADIVGFGDAGAWVALNNGDGTFRSPRLAVSDFGHHQGWRVDEHPRFLVRIKDSIVTRFTDQEAVDVVGFGDAGVRVALNNGDGTFDDPQTIEPFFGYPEGWRPDKHPRVMCDINGDGRADIVGFGNSGVWVARNTLAGNGTFERPRLVVDNLGYDDGWRVDRHPRLLAKLTWGAPALDIVGFGNSGVWVAAHTDVETYEAPRLIVTDFGYDNGWRVDQHPRFCTDVTGNGLDDIVGFGDAGVWVASDLEV
ncbi:VCBS repeat-containing protein [Nocardioides sp. GY 10113]|uniref:FG-GAP repeat domain-containing protein n=1 Tax=Nocardioides sp. GY 10113 TaxID=2569761 RepID=UPI0010A78790|nr:VCBS repeat-containing protein [Nocardioides sp. GY 10113]TIC88900.1 VCBS repeat-containing protein [Nocardioides sp. GY 10113]